MFVIQWVPINHESPIPCGTNLANAAKHPLQKPNRYVNRENPRLLKNLNVHYRTHKNPTVSISSSGRTLPTLQYDVQQCRPPT